MCVVVACVPAGTVVVCAVLRCAGDRAAGGARRQSLNSNHHHRMCVCVCVCAGLPGAVSRGVWVDCERAGGRTDSAQQGCGGGARARRCMCMGKEGEAALGCCDVAMHGVTCELL